MLLEQVDNCVSELARLVAQFCGQMDTQDENPGSGDVALSS